MALVRPLLIAMVGALLVTSCDTGATVPGPSASASVTTADQSPTPTTVATTAPTTAPTATPAAVAAATPTQYPGAIMAVPACRLPVSGVEAGSGGFLTLPGGTFSPDSASNLAIPGQTDPTNFKRGFTWDPKDGKWLPVPREWVQDDFSSYIYLGQGGLGSPQAEIHEVVVATGQDSIYPGGGQLYGYPTNVRPEGVYGGPGPEILMMVDRTGRVSTVDQGRDGLSYLIEAGSLWSTNWDNYHLTDAVRVDPVNGSAQVWFHRPETSWTVGFDAKGEPIVAVGSRPGSQRIVADEIWIVPTPSTGDQPTGVRLYYDPQHPLSLQGAPVASNGGIWFATSSGLFVSNGSPDSLVAASDYHGWIAGACT